MTINYIESTCSKATHYNNLRLLDANVWLCIHMLFIRRVSDNASKLESEDFFAGSEFDEEWKQMLA